MPLWSLIIVVYFLLQINYLHPALISLATPTLRIWLLYPQIDTTHPPTPWVGDTTFTSIIALMHADFVLHFRVWKILACNININAWNYHDAETLGQIDTHAHHEDQEGVLMLSSCSTIEEQQDAERENEMSIFDVPRNLLETIMPMAMATQNRCLTMVA